MLTPHESLTRAIVFQQLNGKAAETILGRFLALFDSNGFPAPSQILAKPVEDLRAAGLSRGKSAYIRNIAEYCVSGTMPSLAECEMMSDAQIIETLTVIKGVGRWTAEMFLIFNLGRPDVLPIHDFGVRKGYQIAFHKRTMPTPKALERYGRRWAPYRSLAAWYLWRATDSK